MEQQILVQEQTTADVVAPPKRQARNYSLFFYKTFRMILLVACVIATITSIYRLINLFGTFGSLAAEMYGYKTGLIIMSIIVHLLRIAVFAYGSYAAYLDSSDDLKIFAFLLAFVIIFAFACNMILLYSFDKPTLQVGWDEKYSRYRQQYQLDNYNISEEAKNEATREFDKLQSNLDCCGWDDVGMYYWDSQGPVPKSCCSTARLDAQGKCNDEGRFIDCKEAITRAAPTNVPSIISSFLFELFLAVLAIALSSTHIEPPANLGIDIEQPEQKQITADNQQLPTSSPSTTPTPTPTPTQQQVPIVGSQQQVGSTNKLIVKTVVKSPTISTLHKNRFATKSPKSPAKSPKASPPATLMKNN